MSNLPSVERDRREPGDADDVPQPAEDEDAVAGRQARRVPDRRHLLCACNYSFCFIFYYVVYKYRT